MAVNSIILAIIGIATASSFFFLEHTVDQTTIFLSGYGTILIIGWLLSSALQISLNQRHLLRTVLLLLMSLVLVVMVNLIAIKHNYRIDLTQERQHSLSEQSKIIIQSIQDPIEIISFLPLSSLQEKHLRILADAIKHENDKISSNSSLAVLWLYESILKNIVKFLTWTINFDAATN